VYLKTVNQVPVQSIKNHLLFQAARYGITYTEHLEDYYSLFMEGSTNPQHRADITQDYDRLRSLSEGQPSPTFTAYENYLGGTTSLSDLKGSYVYIDVWATWCGPCKYEIPFLKTLEKKYHDKNITFVSISIDKAKDHAAWKEMVSAESLKGVQLFADNDWNSQFVKNYLIKGIPRFILLDSEGQIISANAKRPSDPALAELLDTLPI
jgi:thiol-disulfide isomerase/thioredoxin